MQLGKGDPKKPISLHGVSSLEVPMGMRSALQRGKKGGDTHKQGLEAELKPQTEQLPMGSSGDRG